MGDRSFWLTLLSILLLPLVDGRRVEPFRFSWLFACKLEHDHIVFDIVMLGLKGKFESDIVFRNSGLIVHLGLLVLQ